MNAFNFQLTQVNFAASQIPAATPTAEISAILKTARLHYVSDQQPGFSRRRRGRSFAYYDVQGNLLRDPVQLARIRTLAIPPAWTQVWICPFPNSHLQATGRDRRRRKQYRYHEPWSALRSENKFDRLLAFAKALPKLRSRVDADLQMPKIYSVRLRRLRRWRRSATLFIRKKKPS